MARAWVFGDHVDTDQIIPGRYLVTLDPRELAKHVMEPLDPKFALRVQRGDVIVAGKNFGCGSSRERAPLALKAAGISAVVAESFARIFYRNAVNCGLPPVVCPSVRKGFRSGDEIEVDVRRGVVKNLRTKRVFKTEPLPEFMMEVIQAGGLIPYLRKKLSKL